MSAVSGDREWVILLRARSTIRLRGDLQVVINPSAESTAPVLGVRVRNSFSKIRNRLVVTGLFVEARGIADGPDAAVAALAIRATPYLQVFATAGNGAIDQPADILVHAPPTDTEPGRFVERRACDTPPPASVVRSIDASDLLALLQALHGHADEERLQRAMAHYNQALVALDPFNRVMCAESLFMSCENLGQVILRRLYRQADLPDNGESKHKLALDAGFTPPNERSRQHLSDFDSYIRRHYIFDDQKDVYDNLRFASDHFEHGSRSFDEVQAAAHASADLAFRHVRHAILREIGVPAGSSLLTEEKYQYPLAGWQPACQLGGSYTSDRADDWPEFYGMGVVPRIVDVEDLDDDQKRQLTFTVTASTDALLDGQKVTPETYLLATPLPPDRKAEQIAKEEVLTRRGPVDGIEHSGALPGSTYTVDSIHRVTEHPVEVFRKRLAELTTYPSGVVPVPEFLRGTAFFSAASGLFVTDPDGPLPTFPFGGVMFVGHNLDSETAFVRRLASGHAHGGPDRPMLTWRNLYRLLEKASVAAENCFFTNVYVGLKAGEDPTGRFPGAAVPEFKAWCRSFLEEQIAVMRPRVVATLGTDARRFLARLSPALADWTSARNPLPGAVPAQLGGHETVAVALLHPSGYHGSLGRRRYGEFTGLDAEAALLRDALAHRG